MYKFKGTAFLRGVPARDLTDEEAEKIGIERLVNSGLYEHVPYAGTPEAPAPAREGGVQVAKSSPKRRTKKKEG